MRTIARRWQRDNDVMKTGTCEPEPAIPSYFYEGGDEIHDYDRLTSDLTWDYDWHDNGSLPPPPHVERPPPQISS